MESKNSGNFRTPKTKGSFEYQKSAGLIIYYIDDEKNIRFLLLKYPTKSKYWGFVRGIIEDNEDEQETALRELEEETGIKEVEMLIACLGETSIKSTLERAITPGFPLIRAETLWETKRPFSSTFSPALAMLQPSSPKAFK